MSNNDYNVGKNPVTGEQIVEPISVLSDGTVVWQNSPEQKLATVNSVDLNNVATPTLYTVPNEMKCYVTKIVVRKVSTSLTTVSFSIGWNSASYNNVLANASHTELTGAALATILNAMAGQTVGTPGQALCLKNNTLQGAPATCTIDIFGILMP